MSESRRPIARLSIRKDKITYGILSIWRGKFAGTYDISREKPTDKRQAMSFGDALRAWTSGEGYLSFSVESEREPRGDSSRSREPSGGFGDDPPSQFGDDSDIPF